MAITFALRGTSKTAYYSGGFAVPAEYGSNSVDAGDISSVLNLDQASFATHALHYVGKNALPTGQTMSILMRCSTGSTTDANQIFYFGGGCNFYGIQSRFSGGGTIVTTYQTEIGNTNATATYTFAYAANTYYDFVWTLDTSSTTNNFKMYKDGTLVNTTSGSATRAAFPNQNSLQILIGSQNAPAQNSTRLKVSEFVIWDTIIDPTNVALTGGNGSLNGASRTQYVSATAMNDAGSTYSRGRVVNAGS